MIDRRGVAACAIAVLAAACMDPGDFRCNQHAQCVVGNVPGFCEANGRCSVRDESGCPLSHRRYVERAGGDSGACVTASCPANPIQTVSAGGGHACLIRETDHSLWCWGRNDRGQIGDGSRTPRALPVQVTGVSNVVAVAAGEAHTCAAQSDGPVLCWGAADTGQLGDAGRNDRGLPQEVPGVSNVKALAAGKDFSCALGQDAAVRCWGDDSAGQLGDGGASGLVGPPAIVAALSTNVDMLSAAWQHVCVIDVAKKLTCWGANGSGQIGDGTTNGPRLPTTPSPPLPAQVTAVATGHDHTCALAGGDLYCWGDNAQGQVMPLQAGQPVPTPRSVFELPDPIAVAAGGQHTCAVRQGGGVTCIGANTSGQIGDGTPIDNATTVVAGAAFSCALAADRALYCWGANQFGQLAVGGDIIRATPVPVPGLAHAGVLAAGGAHNCATADDPSGGRALYCWGANGSGQVGNGSSADASAVARISSLQPDAIVAGQAHTCAFAPDRRLRCWGSGASGQLGQEPGMDGVITVPTVTDLGGPGGDDGVYAIAAGASHTCVGANISASVLCFGLNTDGQLGNGMSGVPGGFMPVASLLSNDKPTALAAGDAHSCAIDEGAVWCWGSNAEGQLGDGVGRDHPSPNAVALGSDVTAAGVVVAGGAHTCALADGRILCWGRNAEGQVGTPLQMPILTPTPVSRLSNPQAIAAGGRHTCALAGDATVSCWGANESGQLGNGTTDSSNIPVTVAGLTSVDAIATGGAHSCARRTDGTVWCWGANTFGQLGDGITLTSPDPLLARIACE